MTTGTTSAKAVRPRRSRRILLAAGAAFLAGLAVGGGVVYRMTMPGLVFLSRISDSSPEAETAGEPLREREVVIPAAGGRTIPAVVYEPEGGFDRVVVLLHGVHWQGYHEERLVPFARKLAGLGYGVVTPDLEDLRTFDIRPRAVDDIERSIAWTLDDSGLVPSDSDRRVGVMGISFSGGLGLSAASRPALRDRVAFALSFGGHADLDRTMEYLVTGRLPGGGELPAHVYGQVVIAREFASDLVGAEEAPEFRDLCFAYLKGEEDAVEARLESLPPASRELLALAVERDTVRLGAVLAPLVRAARSDDSLSPIRQSPPPFPVFLLHGSIDNVIPPSESVELGRWADSASRVLISDLVVHVELEADDTTWREYWDLSTFITEMLRS